MVESGNCISCDFPIMLNGNNPVTCPMCSTINQPISFLPAVSAVAFPLVLALGGVVIGLLKKPATKKAAKYAAGYAAEKGIDYGSKWAKGKLKGGQ